jgi:hypothetical protein
VLLASSKSGKFFSQKNFKVKINAEEKVLVENVKLTSYKIVVDSFQVSRDKIQVYFIVLRCMTDFYQEFYGGFTLIKCSPPELHPFLFIQVLDDKYESPLPNLLNLHFGMALPVLNGWKRR